MLHVSNNFKLIAGAYLRWMKVKTPDETLDAFNRLNEENLPQANPGKQIFPNSEVGKVLISLGTIALGQSANINAKLCLGAQLIQFYEQDLVGDLKLAQVSEDIMI